ncbi:PIG-L deacetylase family protein [Sphingobium sp. TomMM35A]
MLDLTSAPAIFLQPHADDAALSCGGTAAAIAAAGRSSHIITLFAGEIVPQLVSSFAEWKHSRWNLTDPEEVIDIRRSEDAQAAQTLGCSVRWLGLPDVIYRGDTVTSDDELFGPIDANGLALADHLVDELTSLPEWQPSATVFVPLAIGSHIDHQIVFETGVGLARRGHRVFAWEDAPYVIHTPEGLGQRLEQVRARLGPPELVGIEEQLERKLDAIRAYRTQVPVIFRFTDDFRAATREFARQTGGGVAAERFWPIL